MKFNSKRETKILELENNIINNMEYIKLREKYYNKLNRLENNLLRRKDVCEIEEISNQIFSIILNIICYDNSIR